jgi:hypothetical protein
MVSVLNSNLGADWAIAVDKPAKNIIRNNRFFIIFIFTE